MTARWDETVTVLRVYGDTRLPEGDVVLAVDNRTPAEWATGAPRPNGRSANASATASVVRRRAWTGSSTST